MVERIQYTDRLMPLERPERLIQKQKKTETSNAVDADSQSRERQFQDSESEQQQASSGKNKSVDEKIEKKRYTEKKSELDIVV